MSTLAGVRRVYLAGPMTGYPEFNFPAFRSATAELRAIGLSVMSPAEEDEAAGLDTSAMTGDRSELPKPYDEFMAEDLPLVCRADAVVVLPGWEGSQGATIEATVAAMLGKPVIAYPSLERVEPDYPADDPSGPSEPAREPESVLSEADRLVSGDRQAAYGHPIVDFTRTGRMWGAILGLDRAVEPDEVAMMMVALKLSREVNKPKRDNRVDAAGYVKTLELVREAQGTA